MSTDAAASPRAGTRKWIVAALACVAAAAAAAQFIPMIAASHNRGVATHQTGTAPSLGTAPSVPGLPIAPFFATLDSGGEPPGNVLAALDVPAGSESTGTHSFDGNAGSYDREVTFSSPLASAAILTFYEKFLASHAWRVSGEFTVPHASGREVLAQHAGSDGNYWEVGVSSARTHSFAVRIQLVADQE